MPAAGSSSTRAPTRKGPSNAKSRAPGLFLSAELPVHPFRGPLCAQGPELHSAPARPTANIKTDRVLSAPSPAIAGVNKRPLGAATP
eukprot:14655933-Alexandrium_andersonii.AAC.1